MVVQNQNFEKIKSLVTFPKSSINENNFAEKIAPLWAVLLLT
jgi:hypothetical protein